MSKTGFIGLGIMGKPMALNLLRGGAELMVYDINAAAAEELETAGAKQASLRTIGEQCDVIFCCLPNGSIVQEVLFGAGGVAETIRKGTIVCDVSSVTPIESKTCYEKLAAMGVPFVDAPMSGGEPKAIDGTLSFMAGGDEEAFHALEPCFSMMGSSAVLIGASGCGSVTKLANQIIVNLTIAAVSEAYVFAEKADADPEKVFRAIRGGLAQSTVMDAKIPKILDRDFTPGGKISINHKDIKNVLATAHDLDVPVPMSAQLFEMMQALKVDGYMDEDHCGIIHYFEKLAGVTVKRRETQEDGSIG